VDGVHVSAPVMKALSSGPELQGESAHGRTPTASTRVRSLCDLAEVDIAVDDDGRPFVRRRSSAESRVTPGQAQIEDVNPTRTTIGEVSDLSPGAPPLRPLHRTRSLPTTFITQTPSSEGAQHPRRKRCHSIRDDFPHRMRVALVEDYKASRRGSSYQLTVTAETNGPLRHSETEHYARMMSSFAVEDSDKRSEGQTGSYVSASSSSRLFSMVKPWVDQLSWGRTSNPGRASFSASRQDFKVEASLVFAVTKTSPPRHSFDDYRPDKSEGGGRSFTITREPTLS